MLESGGKIREKLSPYCKLENSQNLWEGFWATGQEGNHWGSAASAFRCCSLGIFWQCPHCVDESNFPWESIRDSRLATSIARKKALMDFPRITAPRPFFANLSKLGTLYYNVVRRPGARGRMMFNFEIFTCCLQHVQNHEICHINVRKYSRNTHRVWK